MNEIQRRGDIDKCPLCGSHCDPNVYHCRIGVIGYSPNGGGILICLRKQRARRALLPPKHFD